MNSSSVAKTTAIVGLWCYALSLVLFYIFDTSCASGNMLFGHSREPYNSLPLPSHTSANFCALQVVRPGPSYFSLSPVLLQHLHWEDKDGVFVVERHCRSTGSTLG
eukprot:PhF_6_TR32088/c1_g2_i1/m.47486